MASSLRIMLIVALLAGVMSRTCNNFMHSTDTHDDHEEDHEGEDHDEEPAEPAVGALVCDTNSSAVGVFPGTLGDGPYKCAHMRMTYIEDGTTHTKASGGCIPADWDCAHIQEIAEGAVGIEDHDGHDHRRRLETTLGTYSCAVCDTDVCNAASFSDINTGTAAQVSLFATSAALIMALKLAMQ
jgi:hypothetical protein